MKKKNKSVCDCPYFSKKAQPLRPGFVVSLDQSVLDSGKFYRSPDTTGLKVQRQGSLYCLGFYKSTTPTALTLFHSLHFSDLTPMGAGGTRFVKVKNISVKEQVSLRSV